jgi:hypothetical protein
MYEFAMARAPLTKETKTFLIHHFEAENPRTSDLSNSAGLALGTSIALDGDPEIIRYVHKEWKETSPLIGSPSKEDNAKRKYMLSVMGNSKSGVFSSEVEEASGDSDFEIRKSAANSVRFAQDSTSRDKLFTTFLKDKSVDVRLTAVQSLQYQPFDELTKGALKECAETEASQPVRLECHRVLGYRIGIPGVREFLAQRQSAEKDEAISNTIGAALSIKQGSAE